MTSLPGPGRQVAVIATRFGEHHGAAPSAGGEQHPCLALYGIGAKDPGELGQ